MDVSNADSHTCHTGTCTLTGSNIICFADQEKSTLNANCSRRLASIRVLREKTEHSGNEKMWSDLEASEGNRQTASCG